MAYFTGWVRFHGSTPTAEERKAYEQRKTRRERKAREAQDEAARCKANALRLIAEQS